MNITSIEKPTSVIKWAKIISVLLCVFLISYCPSCNLDNRHNVVLEYLVTLSY